MVRGSGAATADRRAVRRAPARWCGPVRSGRAVVPSGRPRYPVLPIGARAPRPRRCAHGGHRRPPRRRRSAVRAAPSCGTVRRHRSWSSVASSSRTSSSPRPLSRPARCPAAARDAGTMAVGMAIWAVALVAPAAFLLLGTNRLARMLATSARAPARRRPRRRALADLPDDVVVASGIVLADGAAGLRTSSSARSAPPSSASCRRRECDAHPATATGSCARGAAGSRSRIRWTGRSVTASASAAGSPTTTPTSWSRSTPRSSAVDADVARTTACAVLTPDQLAAWVAALPPQRSLTDGRRERMIEMARAASDRRPAGAGWAVSPRRPSRRSATRTWPDVGHAAGATQERDRRGDLVGPRGTGRSGTVASSASMAGRVVRRAASRRRDRTGRHGIDPDAPAATSMRKGPGETQEGALGRRVRHGRPPMPQTVGQDRDDPRRRRPPSMPGRTARGAGDGPDRGGRPGRRPRRLASRRRNAPLPADPGVVDERTVTVPQRRHAATAASTAAATATSGGPRQRPVRRSAPAAASGRARPRPTSSAATRWHPRPRRRRADGRSDAGRRPGDDDDVATGEARPGPSRLAGRTGPRDPRPGGPGRTRRPGPGSGRSAAATGGSPRASWAMVTAWHPAPRDAPQMRADPRVPRVADPEVGDLGSHASRAGRRSVSKPCRTHECAPRQTSSPTGRPVARMAATRPPDRLADRLGSTTTSVGAGAARLEAAAQPCGSVPVVVVSERRLGQRGELGLRRASSGRSPGPTMFSMICIAAAHALVLRRLADEVALAVEVHRDGPAPASASGAGSSCGIGVGAGRSASGDGRRRRSSACGRWRLERRRWRAGGR